MVARVMRLKIFFPFLSFLFLNNIFSGFVEDQLEKDFYFACNKRDFSGAVLVARKSKILLSRACGFANRDFNVNNKTNTKFNLASVGKIFTSLAIAQLVQEKKISLETPLYKIIPAWLPKTDMAQKITIGDLLTHTSGFENFMDDERWKLGADLELYVTTNNHKPLIKNEKILFPAKSSQLYSNSGYLLLGAVIEHVSNMTYYDYLKRNVFIQSGMSNTGIYRFDQTVVNRAIGYTKVCNEKNEHCYWGNNLFKAPFVGTAAGGAYSTVEDLFKLSQALHHGKLLKKPYISDFFSSQAKLPLEKLSFKKYLIAGIEIPENFSKYGFAGKWNPYGLAIWNDPVLLGHTGGTVGASAFFATSPNGEYTIIVLSNNDSSQTILLYKKIRESLGFPSKIENY